jgi:hypothetical protein
MDCWLIPSRIPTESRSVPERARNGSPLGSTAAKKGQKSTSRRGSGMAQQLLLNTAKNDIGQSEGSILDLPEPCGPFSGAW